MILENNTINILKSFSMIAKSIKIDKGNILRIKERRTEILAHATINQSFDREFCIYDLNNFLASLSLFEKPTLVFDESRPNMVKITSEDDTRSIEYLFCDEKLIQENIAPHNKPKTGDILAEFEFNSKRLSNLTKATAIFNLPEIEISGDGQNIYVKAVDGRKTGSTYHDIVGKTTNEFAVSIGANNIKQLMICDYQVKIGKCVHFIGNNIDYWVALIDKRKR